MVSRAEHLIELAARVGDAHEHHGRNSSQAMAARAFFVAELRNALSTTEPEYMRLARAEVKSRFSRYHEVMGASLASPSAAQTREGAPVKLNIIRKWPEGFEARLQHVWLDVVSFIPNVKLWDLQRMLAEFGFRMEVYEGTTPPASIPEPQTVEQCISALKIALRDYKGWELGYADAIIRDAIDNRGAQADARTAFEEKYRCDANDPSCAPELKIWMDAWNTLSETFDSSAFLTAVQGDGDWADEFLAWYDPEKWISEERACAAFLAGKLLDARRSALEEAASLEVPAPIGNSAWGEARQEGWIDGVREYRDAIRAMGSMDGRAAA